MTPDERHMLRQAARDVSWLRKNYERLDGALEEHVRGCGEANRLMQGELNGMRNDIRNLIAGKPLAPLKPTATAVTTDRPITRRDFWIATSAAMVSALIFGGDSEIIQRLSGLF